jgi:undecaprenyl diphosphate synthase
MDGNGRWAKSRGLPRKAGHRQGVKNVRDIVDAAGALGLKYLTLFAFSAENWNRPKDEIDELMKLLENFLDSQRKVILDNHIRFRTIGDISALPQSVRVRLDKLLAETSLFTERTLVLALNYGSRQEIIMAAKAYAKAVSEGCERVDELTWEKLCKYLYTSDIPDPDLVIRTSGEERISNFLLLQGAYAEYIFCEKNWPDFNKDDLKAAVTEFSKRQRRFGMTGEQVVENHNS